MTDTTTAIAEQQTPRPRPPAIQSGTAVSAFVPTDIEQAFRLANALAMSGMTPKAYGNDVNKCFVGIMAGAELGLAPFQALQSIAVIGNNPAIWGDGALALVQASGLLDDIEETDDGQTATCKLVRKGRSTPIVRSFSMEDAKKAGLAGKSGPWTQYPQRMRQMRARSWAMRDGFADVLKGLHIAEEVRDRPDLMEGQADRPQRLSSDMLAQQAGVTVEQTTTVSEMETVAAEQVQDAEVEDINDGQFEADEARRERLAADIQDDEMPGTLSEAAQQTLDEIDGPLEQGEPEDEAIDPFSPDAPWAAKVAEIKAAMDKAETVIDLQAVPTKFKADLEVMPQEVRDSLARQANALKEALKAKAQA
jgi:hypothetical protein